MGRGIMRVSTAFLKELFCLPDDMSVMPTNEYDEIVLFVDSPAIPTVAEGARWPEVMPVLSRVLDPEKPGERLELIRLDIRER